MRARWFLCAVFLLAHPLRADVNDIFVDASSNSTATNTTTISWTHTVGTGANRYLVVGVSVGNNEAGPFSATYGAQTMSLIGSRLAGGNQRLVLMFELVNPASGANTVTVNVSPANSDLIGGATSFINVNQTTPRGAFSSNIGSTATPTITITTADRELIMDTVVDGVGGAIAPTASNDQVQQWSRSLPGKVDGGGSTKAGGTITNTGTMSWTAGSAKNWAIGAISIKPAVTPTAVSVTNFTARRCTNGTALTWNTGFEADNAGFRVLREEQDGTLTVITPSFVAGSAFLTRSGILAAGRGYRAMDASEGMARYWLDDIDLHGIVHRFGPASISTEPCHPSIAHESDATVEPAAPVRPAADAVTTRSRATRPSTQPWTTQWSLAAGNAAKIIVDHDGWYRVAGADLIAAGIPPLTDSSKLQLFVNGREQAISITGNTLSSAVIEFYGERASTPWSDRNVYWLVARDTGMRVERLDATLPFPEGPRSFAATVERRDHTIYIASLRNGEESNFFGGAVTSDGIDQILTVVHRDPAMATATLTVTLQGGTFVPHEVSVDLNANAIGRIDFANQETGRGSFVVDAQMLRDGDNIVRLRSVAGAEDLSAVASVAITYAHTYDADGGELRLTAPAGRTITIGSFPTAGIRVFDVSDPRDVRELAGSVKGSETSFTVATAIPGTGQRTLLALSTDRIASPVALQSNEPSLLHTAENRGGLLIIAHRSLLPAMTRIADVHRREGLPVTVADIDDVYDEFSYGQKTPHAIKDFIRSARSWSEPPRYVLLGGGASIDPIDYLRFGDRDLVPTYLAATSELETASDDWFADFDDDGIADVPIGRIPAATAAEADAVAAKIASYSASTGDWRTRFLVVADAGDGSFDFGGEAQRLSNLLGGSTTTTTLLRDRLSDSALRSELLARLNDGARLVDYIGHGSVEQWTTARLFTSADAEGLSNGARLPFVVSMTCLNGFFHDVYTRSLGSALLTASNGGAIAVWASSALTFPDRQTAMNEALLRTLASGAAIRIGDAVIAAKHAATDRDVRASWILLGDPALRW